MNHYKKQGLVVSAQVAGCLILRLIFNVGLGIPNIEPLFACSVLVGLHQNYWHTFVFAVINIVIFDCLTAGFGPWTVVTGFMYGLLGVVTVIFGKRNRMIFPKNIRLHSLVGFTVLGTLAYDFVTGCLLGPLMFNQNFLNAFIGQIPFSIVHILGNFVLVTSMSFVYEKFIGYRLLVAADKPEKKNHFFLDYHF